MNTPTTHWRCVGCRAVFELDEFTPEGVDAAIAHSELDDGVRHRLVEQLRPIKVGDLVAVTHIGNRKVGTVTFIGRRNVKVLVPQYLNGPSNQTVETTKPLTEARLVARGNV